MHGKVFEVFVSRELTQFKPGQSGNPSGRPASKLITDRLRARLSDPAKLDQVVDQWLDMIAEGDSGALRELLARTEGKVADNVHHEGGVMIRVIYDGDRDQSTPAPPGADGDPLVV